MGINEDFKILAKKLDSCELLTNDEFNTLNEDIMLLQDAFIGAIAMNDVNKMKQMLFEMRKIRNVATKYLDKCNNPIDINVVKYDTIYEIFNKLSKLLIM